MKIAILTNDPLWTYNLRREIVQKLIEEGNEVTLVLPYGEKIEFFKKMGCGFVDFPFERHGMNPLTELTIYKRYVKVLKSLKPDFVMTYATKQNIYGGMACRKLKIPYISSIMGVGPAMQGGASKILLKMLYQRALKGAKKVFFQNEENMALFSKLGFGEKCVIVPGSGVNVEHHGLQSYPEDDYTRFLFIGRFHTDKGLYEFVDAAGRIRAEFPKTEFYMVGMSEGEEFTRAVNEAEAKGIVRYYGAVTDVREIIGKCHCTVLPSYHEGMANVLLESAAAGRPVIASDISGCREAVDDGKTGFLCKVRDAEDLYVKLKKFLSLTNAEKAEMGMNGRHKMIAEFSREKVIRKYMDVVRKIAQKLN